MKYEFPQYFVKATSRVLRVPNQTLRSWVVKVKFGWVTFISLLFLSVMWQPSTVTGSRKFPSPAAPPLVSLLWLLLETDTCCTRRTVSVASYFWIALLHYHWCCLPSVFQMRSFKWNYIIASVFKFLTNVCSLFWSSQLTENTAGVVEVSLLKNSLGIQAYPSRPDVFWPWYSSSGTSPSPSTPIQFLNSKRNLQGLG